MLIFFGGMETGFLLSVVRSLSALTFPPFLRALACPFIG
jgi:hypothetical protein